MNHANTDISYRSFTKNQNESGVGFAVSVHHQIAKKIVLQSGAEFIQKKYSLIRTGSFTGLFQTFNNSYLQVPLAIALKAARLNRTEIYATGGVYGAFWYSKKIKGTYPNLFNSVNDSINNQLVRTDAFSSGVPFDKTSDRRFEFGWLAGIAVDYRLNKSLSASVKCRYCYAVTSQNRKTISESDLYNRTLFTTIGILFYLTNH